MNNNSRTPIQLRTDNWRIQDHWRHGLPGFPFLASTIAIFSGAQLFALGVTGEYLARIHFRTMERPSYAVHDTTAAEDDKSEKSIHAIASANSTEN